MTAHSRSTVQFSEHSGQLSVQRTSLDYHFSAFVDSELNVCLLQLEKGGQCVKTEWPCEAIAELTGSVSLEEGRVDLKSARESPGWNPRLLKTLVKLSESQTRDIDSVSYVSCVNTENNTDTIVSQWQFLDTSKVKVKDNKPVLLTIRHSRFREDDKATPFKSVRIDYIDFKPIQNENIPSYLDHVDSACISHNMKDVNKTIPTPPTTFRCIKETHVVRPGSQDRDRDVETLHYNHDAGWLHYDAHLSSLDEMTETKIRVTEDFSTGVRYEISKTGKSCKTFSSLSRAGHTNSDDTVRMKTPTEFWNIHPDTAVYLGGVDIRGVPCDAWRVGLPHTSSHGNPTYTLFLATRKWLKKRRLAENSFFPIESVEMSGSSVTHHSYFGFQDKLKYYVPDVSPCYNSNHSVAVRLVLLMSFYKTIKFRPLQFERKFRDAVLQVSGMDSTLRVARIRARPSLLGPFQTRVTFKILGRAWFSANVTVSQDEVRQSASEAVAKLEKAVGSGMLRLTQVLNTDQKILVKAKADSFALLKDDLLVKLPDDDEETSPSGFSVGMVAGLCILALVVGGAAGFGAVYGYKRWSDKELNDIIENGKGPTSTATGKKSEFGMLKLSTEQTT